MTHRGRLTLALGLGTYLAAWAFGARALYAPAVGLVLVAGAAVVWTRLLARPFRLHRRIDPGNPVEGDAVAMEIDLQAGGGILPAAVLFHDPAGGLGGRGIPLP